MSKVLIISATKGSNFVLSKNVKKVITLYQKTILDTAYTKKTEDFFTLKFKYKVL